MKTKNLISKLSFIMYFSIIIASVSLFTPQKALALRADDEKDTTEECPVNPQYTRVICTQGQEDCTPKDC